jgi:hypothetical protein
MFDSLLVLGQVPGTHFTLTFNELAVSYTLILSLYLLRHEYKYRNAWFKQMRTIYCLFSMRPVRGRPRKRAILTGHIDSTLLVNIEFDRLLQRLHLAH